MPVNVAFVVVSLALMGATNANDECSTSQLMGLAGNKNVAGCSKAAGFSGMSTIADLSPEQLKAVCGSSACVALMKDMAAMDLGNCRIPESKIHLQTDIIDAFNEKCSARGSMDSSSSSTGSVSSSNLRESSAASSASSATTVVIGYAWAITLAIVAMLL